MFAGGEARWGIAVYPFRSAEGALLEPGRYLHASYPWIDRRGRNLFYSTVRSTLWYVDNDDGGAVRTRFPTFCAPDHPSYDPADPSACPGPTSGGQIGTYDENSITRGATVLGLWTHGKQVLLDDHTLNNIDFGMRLDDAMHREIALYADTPPVRVGVGRDNDINHDFPAGASNNLNFLESTEHLFHTNDALVPLLPRDVVWILNSGRGSAEVGFDDYLHPDAMVVSDMVPVVDEIGIHYDGFDLYTPGGELTTGPGWSGNEDVRVQNAATTLPHRWVVPAFGAVHGLARLEPVGLGGMRGKGLWLREDAGLTYDIAPQPQSVVARSWYTGLFVDPRTPLEDGAPSTAPRQLLGFPDGTRVQLHAPDHLAYLDATGAVVHDVYLHPDDAFFDGEWHHLGLVTRLGGAAIDLYVDGMLQDQWARLQGGDTSGALLFTLSPGDLVVGAPADGSVAGVRGWYDEVRVFAEEPHREVICNLAHGTLVAVDTGLEHPWRTRAERRPPWVHAEFDAHLAGRGNTPVGLHACYVDHGTDRHPDARHVPPNTTALREAYLHPEGLLGWDAPRPDSTANPHCLSCHVDEPGRPAALGLAALTPDTGTPVQDDPRRQPIQPPPRLYGHIPADFAGPGRPARPLIAPPEGCPTDRLVLPGPVDDCWCPGADADPDGDGLDDCYDVCPDDALGDVEGNGLCESDDLCVGDDATGDSDGDGVCDDRDVCAGDDQLDSDRDGVADACDPCPFDAVDDLDGDGVCASEDACLGADDALGCPTATMVWSASLDTDGDSIWDERTGTYPDTSWVLSQPQRVAVDSVHGGLTHAWRFDGNDGGSRVGNQTWTDLGIVSASATFETWFRVADPSAIGHELLW
jgi:hypothetical protein